MGFNPSDGDVIVFSSLIQGLHRMIKQLRGHNLGTQCLDAGLAVHIYDCFLDVVGVALRSQPIGGLENTKCFALEDC